MLSNVRVDSRQGIVQQINVCFAVSCTGQAHALFLASWQVDALRGGRKQETGWALKYFYEPEFLGVKVNIDFYVFNLAASHFLPDLCEFSTSQQLQVGGQGAGFYHLPEPLLLQGGAKEDVVPERRILDPGLLWHKGEGALGESRSTITQSFQTVIYWFYKQVPMVKLQF